MFLFSIQKDTDNLVKRIIGNPNSMILGVV